MVKNEILQFSAFKQITLEKKSNSKQCSHYFEKWSIYNMSKKIERDRT
jgi:uncharacterized protein YktA (UPF0223 family)